MSFNWSSGRKIRDGWGVGVAGGEEWELLGNSLDFVVADGQNGDILRFWRASSFRRVALKRNWA